MKETLSYLGTKLCENLPLDLTLFEQDGRCTKPNPDCHHAKKSKRTDQSYFCHKKTYTRTREPIFPKSPYSNAILTP